MTPEQIAEARRIIEAATEGPWEWGVEDYSMAVLHCPTQRGEDGRPIRDSIMSISPCDGCRKRAKEKCAPHAPEWMWGRCMTPKKGDADFLAAARARWPEALDALEERDREVARLRERANRLEAALEKLRSEAKPFDFSGDAGFPHSGVFIARDAWEAARKALAEGEEG